MNRVPYRVESARIDEQYRKDKAELRRLYPDKAEFAEKAADLLESYREQKKALDASWRNQNPRRPVGWRYLTKPGT